MSSFKSSFSMSAGQQAPIPPPLAPIVVPSDETNDLLLKDFTTDQRKYIVQELYPVLKQSLLHFMNKSMDSQNYKMLLVTQELSTSSTLKVQEPKPQLDTKPSGFSSGFSMSQKVVKIDSNSSQSPLVLDQQKAQDDAVPAKVNSNTAFNGASSFGTFSMSTIQPQANQSTFSNFSMSMVKDKDQINQNDVENPTAFKIPSSKKEEQIQINYKLQKNTQNIKTSSNYQNETQNQPSLQINVDDEEKVVPFQTSRPVYSAKRKFLTPVRYNQNNRKFVNVQGTTSKKNLKAPPQSVRHVKGTPSINQAFQSLNLNLPTSARRQKASALAHKLNLPSNREIQSIASNYSSQNMKNPYITFKSPSRQRPVTPVTYQSKPDIVAGQSTAYLKFMDTQSSGFRSRYQAHKTSMQIQEQKESDIDQVIPVVSVKSPQLRESNKQSEPQPVKQQSSFAKFQMSPAVQVKAELSPIIQGSETVSDSASLFMDCFDKVYHKKIQNLNPNIFRTTGGHSAPDNFKQIVPNQAYRQQKRPSVFQKIDLTKMDFNNIPNYPKPQQQTDEIIGLLKKSFLTKDLSNTEVEKLAGAMRPRSYKQSELIIKYGDVGSEYFILSKGQVKVIVYKKDTDPNDPEIENKIQFTKIMEKGAGFGELSLLFNDKRSASIQAMNECESYVLDGTIFKTVIIKSSLDKRSLKSAMLDKIKLFDQLDKNQKLKLSEGLSTIYFKKGDFIMREGDIGDNFYIIETGEVECLKLQNNDGKNSFINVRTLKAGEHFGELALINNQKRSLCIQTRSENGCKLLTLDRDSFERILGSIEMHLKKDYDKKY